MKKKIIWVLLLMMILLLTLVGHYIGAGDIIANVIGLTPDKIVSGNTILGVEGSATGGTTDGVKLFNDVNKMHSDTTAKDGDLAVVYGSVAEAVMPNVEYDNLYFPETIILTNPITEEIFVNGDHNFIARISISSTQIDFELRDDYMFQAQVFYNSTDGMTYTRENQYEDTPFPDWMLTEVNMTWENNVLGFPKPKSTNFEFPLGYEEVVQEIFKTMKANFEGLYEYDTRTDFSKMIAAHPLQKSADGSYTYETTVVNTPHFEEAVRAIYEAAGVDGMQTNMWYDMFTGQIYLCDVDDYYSPDGSENFFGALIAGLDQPATKTVYVASTITGKYESSMNLDPVVVGTCHLESDPDKTYFICKYLDRPPQFLYLQFISWFISEQPEITKNNIWSYLARSVTSYDNGLYLNIKPYADEDVGFPDVSTWYITDSQLTANAEDVLVGKIAYGPNGVVVGTAEAGGLDTSDATATASDIILGQTAYVNGEKIEGTIFLSENRTNRVWSPRVDTMGDEEVLVLEETLPETQAIKYSNGLFTNVSSVANAVGLTSDKLVKGNTILGVTGTAEAGGSVELGEYSATFISNKPYSDGSTVKVLYTNDENKLDTIPEPAPFSGKFNGYTDITEYSYGTTANITTDTVFTANKVYRASNTDGHIFTYVIKEEDRDKCSFTEIADYETTSDVLLTNSYVIPPEITVNDGYIYAGWKRDTIPLVIPAQVITSTTMSPIVVEKTEDIVQITFIPHVDNNGLTDNSGNEAFSFGNEWAVTGGIGMFGDKDMDHSAPATILGWNSITLTFLKSELNASYITVGDVFGLMSSAYAYGDIWIYGEDGTEIGSMTVMDTFDINMFEDGKTYKLSGNIGMY